MSHLNKCTWLQISNKNDDIIAYLAIEKITNEVAGIHLEVIRWTHKNMIVLLRDWKTVIARSKSQGIRYLIAANPDIEDPVWPRFIKWFGFPEPITVRTSKQEI